MQGQFEIISGDGDGLKFRLRSATGSILATSHSYADRDALAVGVRSFQQFCMSSQPFERARGDDGRWHFIARASDGGVLAESPSFDTEKLMDASVKLTQLNAPRAPIAADRTRKSRIKG